MTRTARGDSLPPGSALARLLAAEGDASRRLEEARAGAAAIEAEGERAAAQRLAAVEVVLARLADELESDLARVRTERLAALVSTGAAALAVLESALHSGREPLVAGIVEAVLEDLA